MVRAPRAVWSVCTTVSFSGVSSSAIVVVPSPQEAKASLVASSKAQPSTPEPIGTLPTTLPLTCVEHHHHLVVATGEQAMMRGIKRDAAWFFARSDWPARRHLMLRRIDRDDFILVLDVAINTARRAIDRGELRTSAERNRAHHCGRLRIDHGRGVAGMIKNINLTAARII